MMESEYSIAHMMIDLIHGFNYVVGWTNMSLGVKEILINTQVEGY